LQGLVFRPDLQHTTKKAKLS